MEGAKEERPNLKQPRHVAHLHTWKQTFGLPFLTLKGQIRVNCQWLENSNKTSILRVHACMQSTDCTTAAGAPVV